MTDKSWEDAMARLAAAQRDFVNGDATGIKALYSHREDVTVTGGFGGFERGWSEVGPRLDWAASQFAGGSYRQEDLSAIVGPEVACLVSLERWSYTNDRDRAENLLELRDPGLSPRGGRVAAPPPPCRFLDAQARAGLNWNLKSGSGPPPLQGLA